MMESGVLKISAMVNPFQFENSILAHIGMELETRTHKDTNGETRPDGWSPLGL